MKYDVIVVGSGAGGYYSALSCSERGMKTALIEREELGGTAFRWGSLAVKRVLDAFRRVDEDRVRELDGEPVRIYREEYKKALRSLPEIEEIIEERLKRAQVDLIRGEVRIEAGAEGWQAEAGEVKIEGKNIILATGTTGDSRWKGERIITHRELFSMETLPKRICLVGGNVEGIELANITTYMGIDTVVVEAEDEVLRGTMRVQAEPVIENLEKRGARFLTGKRVKECISQEEGVRIDLQDGDSLTADLVVVTGIRRPGLPEGIEMDMRGGWIAVDKRYETSLGGIYAVGDINGLMGMANAARYQGEQMGDILMGGSPEKAYPKSLSRAIYTIPEIAATGSEGEYSGTGYLRNTFRGWSKGEESGFVRIEADREGRICGIFMSGEDVSEYLGPLGRFVDEGMTLEEAKKIMMAHPTMMEAFHDAVVEAERDYLTRS